MECEGPGTIYFQCVWWAAGMLMGAPISLTPDVGPYTPHFSSSRSGTGLLTEGEQAVVLTLKSITAVEWITVIARFVQVYNNLDPDTRDFRVGWDDLNSFVHFFGVSKPDALELRRYYIERTSLVKVTTSRHVHVHIHSASLVEVTSHHVHAHNPYIESATGHPSVRRHAHACV